MIGYAEYAYNFRVYDDEHGMCEVADIDYNNGIVYYLIYNRTGACLRHQSIENMSRWSGHKDTTNKYIYEGDIVEVKSDNDLESTLELMLISYINVDIGFMQYQKLSTDSEKALLKDVKIVGNKYENLELLK